MREKRRESKRRIKRRKSPRETFLSKWYMLHTGGPWIKWYEVKVCRITSKMNATEYDEFYAKYFPKTAKDKELEEWREKWREKKRQEELEQMSPEEREVLDNFWKAFEKEKLCQQNRKAMSIVEVEEE